MANLAAATNVENGMQQYAFFSVNTVSGGGAYLHMETNITQPSSNVMIMIEAVGYCYSTAKPIRCAWNFYSYSYYIGNAINTNYNGAASDGGYYTAAGYVCIRAYLPGQHYACFILNAYPTAGNGAGTIVSIRRSSQNNTSGNYY
jgi:hypothetical protein